VGPVKTYLALILILFLGLVIEPGRASGSSFTVFIDAGQLTSPASAPMQADNTSPSSNGSLLLLIDLGSSNAISNTLTPGNYVSGTNTILAAFGFNTLSGTNETQNLLDIMNAGTPGDLVALRWFPQITYAQYLSGTLPVAGNYFGTYNPGGGNPDGGQPWVVPASPSSIDLYFATTNSDSGPPPGTQPPAAGFAGFQVSSSGTISFSEWQSTYFNAQELGEPTVSGASATPENDGVPNLLKYLYAINPTFPMSAADRAALPSVEATDDGSFLTLTYRENPTVTGITINAQASSDLQSWSDISSQQVSTDPLTGDLIMQAQVARAGTKQFLRLEVTSP
jgi:hypothetical protein